MWNIIEAFGLERELLDNHNRLAFEEVKVLYLTIKNHGKKK